ncbi:MAG TPA: glycosyltransferase [Moheibacter sp.]|nr:glycosyltransferase [Moheibacter sp.]
MDNIVVSISCITYNHGHYIRECLDGILMQQCDFTFEILIHDDASTDETQEIIKEYQEKFPDIIKPVFQNENQYSQGIRGLMSRFNFPRAKGKYIAICEGDDYWTDPLKLQKQVDFLEENPNYNISFHRAVRITPDGKKLDEFPSMDLNTELKIEDLAKNNFIPNLSVVVRNHNLDYSIGKDLPLGDYAMHMLNAKKGLIHYHKEVMAAYRINVGVFSSIDKYKQRENSMKTLNGLIDHYGFEGIVLENLIQHRNNLLYYIYKDKFKIKPVHEFKKMLQGKEDYSFLSLPKRLKFILKSIIAT